MKFLRLSLIPAVLIAASMALPLSPIAAAELKGPSGPPEYHKVQPPSWYGSVVMKKNIKKGEAVAPVVFKHWLHRRYYTCNVCHGTLDFAMKAGKTDIRQADIEAGKKCGACHNGEVAFGPDKCLRCHSYGLKVKENSRLEYALKGMPKDDFGNKVNWVKALRKKKIRPAASLEGKGKLKSLDKDIIIPSTIYTPAPPAVLFPHKAHTEVMDCKSCHPGRFKAKKGGTPGMDMMKIINGRYCGACHGKVAFPLEDCFRCHSQAQIIPDWITGADEVKEKAAKEKQKKEREKKKKEEEERKKKKKGPRKFLF